MAEKKKKLGRGLAALLGEEDNSPKSDGDQARGADRDAVAAPPAAAAGASMGAPSAGERTLPVEKLHPGKYQPRVAFDEEALESLAASIAEQGVLQPILVRPHPDKAGDYEIVAGERRWRAAQKARLHEVPVLVRELADGDVLEVAIVENVQRQDLNALEEAEGYARLMEEFGHTAELVGKLVGKSRSHIANTLRLLKLPIPLQMYVRDGRLSAGHARALLTARDPVGLGHEVVKKGLSVRETERLAQKSDRPGGGGGGKTPPAPKDRDTLNLEEMLASRLGLKAEIDSAKGEAGKLVLHYRTLDQLDDLIEKLSG